MAIPNYKINIGVRDSENNISTVTHYSDALTDAAARQIATDLGDEINAMTDGVVASVELVVNILTNGAVPAGNVDNEAGATFTFLDVDSRAMQVTIPAFTKSLILPNSDQVDLSALAVSAYTTDIVSDDFVTHRNLDVTTIQGGVESWRKRNKRR